MNKLGFTYPLGTILYEGPLFLHSTSKNKEKDAFVTQPEWKPLCCIFLCGLISAIQILPWQQLMNQFYLQWEIHLCKFYSELHIMRKIRRFWEWDVTCTTPTGCWPHILKNGQMSASHNGVSLQTHLPQLCAAVTSTTSAAFHSTTCSPTEEHSDAIKTLSHTNTGVALHVVMYTGRGEEKLYRVSLSPITCSISDRKPRAQRSCCLVKWYI